MRAANRVPKYRRQKEWSGHDRAIVELDGHRIHLGEYDSESSRQRYDRLIAQWLANGRAVPPPAADDPDDVTIVELAAAFMRHATEHYRKRGVLTSSVDNYMSALRPLVRLYGGGAVNAAVALA